VTLDVRMCSWYNLIWTYYKSFKVFSILADIAKSQLLERSDITDQDRATLDNFKGGKHWARNFVKRHKLRYVSLVWCVDNADEV
jgi:hypothetical protein